METTQQAPTTFDNTRTKASILRKWYRDYPVNGEYESLCNKAQNETERRTLIDRYNRGEVGFLGNGHFNEDGTSFIPDMPDVKLDPNAMRKQTAYNRMNKIDQLVQSGGIEHSKHRGWIRRLYAFNVMGLTADQYRQHPELVEMPPPMPV